MAHKATFQNPVSGVDTTASYAFGKLTIKPDKRGDHGRSLTTRPARPPRSGVVSTPAVASEPRRPPLTSWRALASTMPTVSVTATTADRRT